MDLLGKGALRNEIAELRSEMATLETRAAASAYTDAIVRVIAEGVRNGNLQAESTAAYETAAGLWERAFKSAEIKPDSIVTRGITPMILGMIGRELITGGEIVFDLTVEDGQVKLTPAQTWDIDGGPNPDSWVYKLTLSGPSANRLVTKPASGVIHCRYGSSPSEPWRGQGPLSRSLTTSKLAGVLESKLHDELSGPVGSIIPTPTGKRDELGDDLKGLDGQTAIVDDVGGDWSAGLANSRQAHWQQIRIGATPPMELINLRSDTAVSILTAAGVPAELVQKADGSAMREAWRQFLHGSVDPVAKDVASELSDKLETEITLSFERLFASDLTGRARAFQSMVGGGMEIDKAATLAGLLMSD